MSRSKTDVLLVLLHVLMQITSINTNGLTDAEVASFTVSGNFEASVRVNTSITDSFIFYASGMPDHAWEKVNPNTPTNQNYVIEIPRNPQQSQTPGCVPLGIIGLARTGVALFNPLTIQNQNAVDGNAAEVFDSCDGHSDAMGVYHYHKLPKSCLYKHEVDEFIGVALDGYPIYGPIVSAGLINHGGLENGGNVTSAHLDKCHGTTVNGKYRYYMTTEFPYILGCFKGNVIYRTQRVTYSCVNDTSSWNADWSYYLCHCTTQGGPGGPGGQGGGDRPECAPDYPNRPDTCPPLIDCSPNNSNRPQMCNDLCSGNSNRPRPMSCDATTTRTTLINVNQPSNAVIYKPCSLIVFIVMILHFGCYI